jgi:hypothetical protein
MPDTKAFIPITKVDAVLREVWGFGAIEMEDAAGEIMDFASSKPEFIAWSEGAHKRSGGKSFGNLRAMHKTTAAGKLISFQPDDVSKGFMVGAKIVDDDEWKKVQEGVYTGFSIGGSYLKRWPDMDKRGLTRYTAKPTELSLVDAPCIPGATFQMMKAEGMVDVVFKPTNTGEGLVWELPELEKAVTAPASPEALPPVPTDTYMTIQVHHMPEPNRTITITSKDGMINTSTEELTQATVKTQELLETAAQLIKSLPALIEEAVAKTVEAELNKVIDGATSTDTRRFVKVERKESHEK